MAKRTYYCVEMGCASYPVNEIHAQSRPFADPQTQARCHRVRAESKDEAAELVRDRLNREREADLAEQVADDERGYCYWPSR
jgi:hypothetical protein